MRYRQYAAAAIWVAALAPLAAAQRLTGPHPAGPIPALVPIDTTGLFRGSAAQVGEDLFVTGQPTERALRELRGRGVTTVVNLRTPEEMQRSVSFDEAALVAQLGMKYVHVPVRGDSAYPYSPAAVTTFANALKTANGKVLLHCTVAWRASHLWAAYLITERGVRVDSALANAHVARMDMGHTTSGREMAEPVEGFVGRHLAELKRGQ